MTTGHPRWLSRDYLSIMTHGPFVWSHGEFFTPALTNGFHYSQSDSKSPQVSTTPFSILADLNNAVVWMVSSRSLISKSPSPCTNPLGTIPSALIQLISPSLSCSIVFSVLLQDLCNYLSCFPSVLPGDQPEWQSQRFGKLSFFVDIY